MLDDFMALSLIHGLWRQSLQLCPVTTWLLTFVLVFHPGLDCPSHDRRHKFD